MEQNTRNFDLDILRALGLFLIILAHCQPPSLVFQLRNFDVPLMVIVSAATFAMLYRDKTINTKEFYIKRLKKLILPAWYFLTFYFTFIFLQSLITHTDYPYSLKEITGSFTFYEGIGYVWILRIFLFIALLTPPLLYLNNKITYNLHYILFVLALYIPYEILAATTLNYTQKGEGLGFFWTVLLPIIPYAALYAYGLKISDISEKMLIAITAICLIIFLGLGYYYLKDTGEIVPTQYLKYPPQIYYLSYALLCTNIAYLFVKKFYPGEFLKPFLSWVSENSLWIYLWHIFAIYVWMNLFIPPEKNLIVSAEQYIFVCAFAIAATKLQLYAKTNLNKVLSRNSNGASPC